MYTYGEISLSRGHSRKSTNVGWEEAQETVYVRLDDNFQIALTLEEAQQFVEDLQLEIKKTF